jgi:hypothetical protein
VLHAVAVSSEARTMNAMVFFICVDHRERGLTIPCANDLGRALPR